jgi:alpha-tubulin suppressor-like RCC1 family protein
VIHILSKSALVLCAAFSLAACGGSNSSDDSGTGQQSPISENKTLDSLVKTTTIQNQACPNGGIEVEMGIDANANGRLDPSEVDHARTETVCHGLDGEHGESQLISITQATLEECSEGGKKILIGLDQNANNILEASEALQTELICNQVINTETRIGSLVSTSVESPGANCSAGGVRIDTGFDNNNDQILAASEVQATNYICSGEAGTDGQNGENGSDGINGADGNSNLDDLLIESIEEPFGENCLHGGSKHRIGLDANQDGALQQEEILSASYTCNYNSAPKISISGREQAIAGFNYSLSIRASDYDNSAYGTDAVTTTVIQKPSWLSITDLGRGEIYLSGVVEGNVGDVHPVIVMTTDGELTTEETFNLTIIDGIQVTVSAADVVEGNLTQGGQAEVTQGQFVVRLTQAARAPMSIRYQAISQFFLPDQSAGNYGVYEGGLLEFAAGEVEKKIDVKILGDNNFEAIERIILSLSDLETTAEESILLPSNNALMNIINDDDAMIWFANQPNTLPIFFTIESLSIEDDIRIENLPSWMSIRAEHVCHSNCQFIPLLTGNPSTDLIGSSGEIELIINLKTEQIRRNIRYRVTEGDRDQDGILDSLDIFPDNPRGQTDSDSDGLGDEWELANFESLTIANSSSDFDGNGITDLLAFQNGSPISDRDADGVSDTDDAFPDNVAYKLDQDKDGMADEWENQYGSIGYLSAEGDHDNDGRTNLIEFLDGTNPLQANLNAVEDILAVVQGQTITFNPAENDIASQDSQSSITTVSVSLPAGEQANFGSLQDNADGTFSYTAANDRLGWLRLSYVANDGESNASGEIFIHIVDQASAQVVKIDGADTGGSYHSMALFDDGSLYAWGANGQGQLGLGTTINNYVPTRVGGLPEIIDFSLGYEFSLALAVDGTVWKWGNGVSVATQLAVTGIKGIAASSRCCSPYYYLLEQDGSVTNTVYNTNTDSLSNIKEIKAGYNHLLALDESGIVWAVGSNSSGQIGYGQDTDSVSRPVQVSKITNIKSIEAGNSRSFAIDTDGQLFAWGFNDYGQLGDSTTISRNVPVLISSLTNVAEVAAGYLHTLVRTDAGDLYGMGNGNSGALGDTGNSYRIMTPIKLTEEKVTSIGTGNYSSFFIADNGLSYSFGINTNGQLGDGTTQNHSDPAEISWLLDGVVSELGKEGFEWGRIPPYWRNSGNNWEVISNETATDVRTGSYAVKVKDRLTDSASASLGLQIATGAGDVSFNVKTSTEAEYDKLVFYVDGEVQATFSGENDWVSSANISVTAGVHSFEWIYHKDGGTSAGDDTVWLDDILLPIDSDGDGIIDRQDASPYVPNPAL